LDGFILKMTAWFWAMRPHLIIENRLWTRSCWISTG
jgi:hypothetical protein